MTTIELYHALIDAGKDKAAAVLLDEATDEELLELLEV